MVVKLSSYRVSAEMDASGYVRGASQVSAASQQASGPVTGLGTAIKSTDTKVSQSGDVLTRLSRNYVEGFGAAERFTRAINLLGRGIETGNVPMERAEAILDGIYRKYGMVANATELAERGHYQLAAAVTALNARFTAEEAVLDSNTAALRRNAAASNAMMQRRRDTMFQLTDIAQGVPLLFQSPGYGVLNIANQMAQVSQAYYGQGGMAAALTDMGSIVGGLATKFAPVLAVIAAATLGIAGMTAAINETSDVTVSFGDTALAIWQVVSSGVAEYLAPAAAAITPLFAQAWDNLKRGTADVVNNMVRGYMGFAAEMELIAGTITHVFDLAWQDIYNGGVDLMQQLLESVWRDLNKLLTLLGKDPVKVDLSMMKLDSPTNNWSGPLLDRFNARKDQINSTDYAGKFFSDVSDQAQQNAIARMAGDAEKATKSLADKGFGKLIEQVNVFADAASSAFSNLGSGIIDAFKKGGDVAANILDMIGDRVGQLGEKLLNAGLNSLFDTALGFLFPSPAKTAASFVPGIGGYLPSANGNVFSGPGISAYSNTVVSRPTLFPFANGIGLMGEAGDEAIMPLRRGPDGRLGVQAANANAAPNVTVNVRNEVSGAQVDQPQVSIAETGEIIVDMAVRKIEKNMAKGNYRSLGVGPGLKRA